MNPHLDTAAQRWTRRCRRMEKELVAALPQGNAKEQAVLCELAVETIRLGNQFALFREKVRLTRLPPKERRNPPPPVL